MLAGIELVIAPILMANLTQRIGELSLAAAVPMVREVCRQTDTCGRMKAVVMFEVTTEYDVSIKAPHPVDEAAPGYVPFAHLRSRQLSTVGVSRPRDPLGEILVRLHSQRGVLELLETAQTGRVANRTHSIHSDVSQQQATPEILPLLPAEAGTAPSAVDPGSQVASDRRRFPRRQSECEVALIPRQKAVNLTPQQVDWLLQASRQVGRLLDISASGLCLLLNEDLEIGSEVLLRISNQRLNRHIDNSATVIRSQSAGHGKISIHCVVQREFSLDQLQDLGRPQIPGHVLA